MSGPIGRGPSVPEQSGPPQYDIIWPRIAAPLDVTFLDGGWLALWVHWVQDRGLGSKPRSRLCTLADEGGCLHCEHARKWAAYIPVLDHGRRCVAVLVVSENLARTLAGLTAPVAGLYGMRVELRRASAKYNAPVAVRLSEAGRAGALPRPHSIIPTLATVFGVPTRIVEVAMTADLTQAEEGAEEDGQQ